MRILIIEDETKTVKFLAKGLKEEGHAVAFAQNGRDGLEIALNENFDAIILDLMLPAVDGLSICRDLRKNGIATPILMLTAKDTVENKIEGLDAGADDYLSKPFSFGELTARLRALARRTPASGSRLEVDGLEVDLVARKARFQGNEFELTGKEFALLNLFMRRPGHILSRSAIADNAWGRDFDSETNVIDVYVTFLRKKLRQATGRDWIRTYRGQGYAFEAAAED